MNQVKVTKGEETVTAVFNEKITAWAQNNYRGIVLTICNCCQKYCSSRKLVAFSFLVSSCYCFEARGVASVVFLLSTQRVSSHSYETLRELSPDPLLLGSLVVVMGTRFASRIQLIWVLIFVASSLNYQKVLSKTKLQYFKDRIDIPT